jgi:hypothetical protein
MSAAAPPPNPAQAAPRSDSLLDICTRAVNPASTWSDSELHHALSSLATVSLFDIAPPFLFPTFSIWLRAVWTLLGLIEARPLTGKLVSVIGLGRPTAHFLNHLWPLFQAS